MKFTGTKNYVSTEDLSMAVNATIALERPLIIKGSQELVRHYWLLKWLNRWEWN